MDKNIKPTLTVTPGRLGGYVVLNEGMRDMRLNFCCEFAGTLDQCLQFIHDQYNPKPEETPEKRWS